LWSWQIAIELKSAMKMDHISVWPGRGIAVVPRRPPADQAISLITAMPVVAWFHAAASQAGIDFIHCGLHVPDRTQTMIAIVAAGGTELGQGIAEQMICLHHMGMHASPAAGQTYAGPEGEPDRRGEHNRMEHAEAGHCRPPLAEIAHGLAAGDLIQAVMAVTTAGSRPR
jgi:hypothetical protein